VMGLHIERCTEQGLFHRGDAHMYPSTITCRPYALDVRRVAQY
jgi:hypothetical protein